MAGFQTQFKDRHQIREVMDNDVKCMVGNRRKMRTRKSVELMFVCMLDVQFHGLL